MATYSYDKPTRVLTITFTPKEDKVLTKVNQVNGPSAIKNMFETWFLAQVDTFTKQDLSEAKGRLVTATDVELAAIRTILGLP